MILHVISMLGAVVDKSVQTPLQIQCVLQTPSDPWWKWLLPTIVQTIVSLLSIGAGVTIAVWSFRRNRQTEHEQWTRDQKNTEWSSLLHSVANVYQITHLVNGWNRPIADRIVSQLEPALKEVSVAQANCIFLDKFRLTNEGGRRIMEFIRFATMQSERIRGNLGLFDSIQDSVEKAGSATDDDNKSRLRCVEVVSSEVFDLAEQSYNLLVWLQNEAALNLGKTSEGEKRRAAMRWTKRFHFTRKKTGS